MIGDVSHAHGKRKSTRAHGPEFKAKNGRSNKHVASSKGKDDNESGGDHEMRPVAKRATKGHRPGTHVADRQAPHKQKERIENKHVDQGNILDEWCRGKRGKYK